MLKQLKRQYHNIFKIGAVSFWPLFFNSILFPFRWRFNLNTRPINIVWDITYRCNLNCKYCLFAKNKLHTIQNELSSEKIKDFVEKIARYKPSFFLTGGEPLLRQDLEEIISTIRFYKMKVGINTNTTLLTKERLLKLDKAGLNYMIISLDMNENVTDDFRGLGVYKKAFEAIKMLKEIKSKIKIVVNCVINESNYQYLDNFLDFIENLSIDALKLSYVYFNTKGEADDHQKECERRLNEKIIPDCYEKEVSDYGSEIAEKIKSVMPKIDKMKTPVSFNPNLNEKEIISWFDNSKILKRKCLYIFNVVRFSPNGDIYPCHFINKPVGNIMEGEFIDIYNNEFYKKLRRELKKSLFPGCVRCNKL
ncbi:MAG: radical SAM protein [Patescibacteria group bacterium]